MRNAEYKGTIMVSPRMSQHIKKYLNEEPASRSECLSEDEKIAMSVTFTNGVEMSVECCGVQYDEDEPTNTAWTQAVLYKNGCEVACSDVGEEFFGEWELSDSEGNVYTAVVKTADAKELVDMKEVRICTEENIDSLLETLKVSWGTDDEDGIVVSSGDAKDVVVCLDMLNIEYIIM